MRFYRSIPFPFILLAAAFLNGAEPPAPPRAQIKFPDIVTPLAPAPKPDPGAVPKLTGETLYVVESAAPLVLIASPDGLAKVVEDAGPLKIRGRFIDGDGKSETRTYKGPHVYTIEATGKGRIELIAWPTGGSVTDVVRKTVDVDAGAGPQPPPGPTPPVPDPPTPAPAGFRAIFIYESSANLTREQLNILNSTAIADYLNRKTVKTDNRPGWRKWDKDIDVTKETETWRALWEATKPKLGKLPQVLIVTGGEGQLYPLPETEAATLQLLKSKGGE